MSQPSRLRDEGPDELRALLRHAPRTAPMSARDKARTRARLAPVAALAAGVGSLAWLQGAAIGATLGVLAVGASTLVPSRAPTPPLPPREVPAASSHGHARPARFAPAASSSAAPDDAPPEAPLPAAPVPAAPPPRSAQPLASAPPDPAPPPTKDTMAEEAAMLERARAALGTSPERALAITEEHAAEFPSGKLGVERELLAIEALRHLGRTTEARARAEALAARARGGIYDERIRALLDSLR